MPSYTVPKGEIRDLVETVMAQYHGDLVEAGVTVGLLACWPGERDDPSRPALKLHGYTCAATIKIRPLKDRLEGMTDALLTIDGGTWKDLDQAGRVALIDHELQHLELRRDDQENIALDDACRPKLRTRLHDWQLGGFAVIAKRHGPIALEVSEFRRVAEEYHQVLFPWADDCAPQDPPPDNLPAVLATPPPASRPGVPARRVV